MKWWVIDARQQGRSIRVGRLQATRDDIERIFNSNNTTIAEGATSGNVTFELVATPSRLCLNNAAEKRNKAKTPRIP
jgi:hypothetical protein